MLKYFKYNFNNAYTELNKYNKDSELMDPFFQMFDQKINGI